MSRPDLGQENIFTRVYDKKHGTPGPDHIFPLTSLPDLTLVCLKYGPTSHASFGPGQGNFAPVGINISLPPVRKSPDTTLVWSGRLRPIGAQSRRLKTRQRALQLYIRET